MSLEEREAHLRAWRKSVNERRGRKLRLRDAAHGPETLFAPALEAAFGGLGIVEPVPHAESEVPAFEGLLCLGGDGAWVEVSGGRLPANQVYHSGVAAIDFAVQCVHRLLPCALWMARHVELCPDATKESSDCILCALWRCREDFGNT